MIRQNLGYKIVALIAAIMLWFYVTGDQNPIPSYQSATGYANTSQPTALKKALLVSPTISGEPARGYRVADVSAEPREVLASGSREALRNLDMLRTDPVQIDGATGSISQVANYDVPKGIFLQQGTIRVTVRIEPIQNKTEPSKSQTQISR